MSHAYEEGVRRAEDHTRSQDYEALTPEEQLEWDELSPSVRYGASSVGDSVYSSVEEQEEEMNELEAVYQESQGIHVISRGNFDDFETDADDPLSIAEDGIEFREQKLEESEWSLGQRDPDHEIVGYDTDNYLTGPNE